MKPIAIIGLGNYLMGDEGVGIHAVQKLKNDPWPDDIEIIDAGVPSLALLHLMEGRELVIVIDCVDFGGHPGEIKVFKPHNVKRPKPDTKASLHAADLLTTFDIAHESGLSLPPVWIVGIQPARVAMTMDLSKQATAALDGFHSVIDEILRSEGYRSLH